jgi:hypothetical protein
MHIFFTLQHFATKLCNFTKFRTLFQAVIISFLISNCLEIWPVRLKVHCFHQNCFSFFLISGSGNQLGDGDDNNGDNDNNGNHDNKHSDLDDLLIHILNEGG